MIIIRSKLEKSKSIEIQWLKIKKDNRGKVTDSRKNENIIGYQ